MKTIHLFGFLAFVFFYFQSCSTKVISDKPKTRSFEFIGRNKDTVNRKDWSGNKQGHWIVQKFIATNTGCNAQNIKVEEGFYKDNKKEGLWKKFAPTGQLIDSANYYNDAIVQN